VVVLFPAIQNQRSAQEKLDSTDPIVPTTAQGVRSLTANAVLLPADLHAPIPITAARDLLDTIHRARTGQHHDALSESAVPKTDRLNQNPDSKNPSVPEIPMTVATAQNPDLKSPSVPEIPKTDLSAQNLVLRNLLVPEIPKTDPLDLNPDLKSPSALEIPMIVAIGQDLSQSAKDSLLTGANDLGLTQNAMLHRANKQKGPYTLKNPTEPERPKAAKNGAAAFQGIPMPDLPSRIPNQDLRSTKTKPAARKDQNEPIPNAVGKTEKPAQPAVLGPIIKPADRAKHLATTENPDLQKEKKMAQKAFA
jgi:hypothetical protein